MVAARALWHAAEYFWGLGATDFKTGRLDAFTGLRLRILAVSKDHSEERASPKLLRISLQEFRGRNQEVQCWGCFRWVLPIPVGSPKSPGGFSHNSRWVLHKNSRWVLPFDHFSSIFGVFPGGFSQINGNSRWVLPDSRWVLPHSRWVLPGL